MKLNDRRERAQRWLDLWEKNMGHREVGPELVWGQAAGLVATDSPILHYLGNNYTALSHFLLRWAMFGCPVFTLSHGLLAKLLLTDPRGLRHDEVKWPFETFLLQLPGPDPFLTYADGEGKEMVATTIMFHRYKQNFDKGMEYKMQWDGDRSIFLKAAEVQTRHAWWMDLGTSEEIVSLHRVFPEPTNKEEMRAFISSTKLRSERGFALQVYPKDHEALASSSRLLLNLLIYLGDLRVRNQWNAERPDNQKEVDRKKGKTHRLWKLGREITLTRELRDLALNGSITRPHWKLRSRFFVRGHFKEQPCGPGGVDRRRQWIEPYMKGPAEGERLDRTYRIDQKDS